MVDAAWSEYSEVVLHDIKQCDSVEAHDEHMSLGHSIDTSMSRDSTHAV